MTVPGQGRFRRWYGASGWHLLAMLGCFALSGYAVSRLLGDPALITIAVWFVGAAVVWDFALGPAFGVGDRLLRLAAARLPHGSVRLLPYLRAPAALSGLLLLVWAPLILRRSPDVYGARTGLSQDPYLGRWVVVTAALFALSGLVGAVAAVRARR